MRQRVTSIVLASALGLGGVVAGVVLAPVAATAATSGTVAVGDRLDRIKDALAGLVSDGSITQEQADEVATTLDEALPQGRGGGHGPGAATGGGLRGLDTAATTLGVTEDELRAALQGGSVARRRRRRPGRRAAGTRRRARRRGRGAPRRARRARRPHDEQVASAPEARERVEALVDREGLPLGRGRRGAALAPTRLDAGPTRAGAPAGRGPRRATGRTRSGAAR